MASGSRRTHEPCRIGPAEVIGSVCNLRAWDAFGHPDCFSGDFRIGWPLLTHGAARVRVSDLDGVTAARGPNVGRGERARPAGALLPGGTSQSLGAPTCRTEPVARPDQLAKNRTLKKRSSA